MALSKSLLLKGIAGVAAVGGVATGGAVAVKSGLLGIGDNKATDLRGGDELSKFSHKELIDKVGLSCGLTGKDIGGETKECKVKDNGTISIKVEDQIEEGITFTDSGTAKLRVKGSKGGEDYSRGLKFVVDSGNISLTKSGGTTTTQKLEQFETYEIKKEGDKFYLERKTKADVGIKNALGLGELTLPDNTRGETSNSYGDAGKIKLIRFEGHEDGISISSGSITLKVAKTVDDTTFPFGYRFNFTFPSEITINGKKLKGNIPYEFKIKKGTGNSLTLEQAWTDDNTFTKKAGLDCTNNSQCTVVTDSKLNVKVGHLKKTDISSITGSGKIKMEKDKEGYNQGLKFSIAEGDVTFTGGTGEVEKLEELETYEIAEDGGKYYLTKKTSPDDLIKSSLSLPGGCELPTTDTPVVCNLDDTKFKAINFEGKSGATGSGTLTISKANSTDFPFGYKFTFKTETEATVKSDTKIKAKIPTDFKIKKGAGSGTSVTLSLEKAWDDTKLAEKVGLNCTTDSEGCCTKATGGTPSVKLNVKRGSDVKEGIDSVETSTGKIKVEKDKEGYNQGLKFTITTADVTLTGGNKVGNSADFNTLEELETYEITEDKGKYYLTRKTSKEDVLKTSLSIPEKCFTSLGTSCSLTTDDFQKINFEGKESFNPSGTATLTVTKADKTDFPLGYRFTFNTTSDATIKSGSTTIKAKIPTDFKIKKNQSTPTTLTLEKAWNDSDYSFAKKAGLTCTTSSGDTCCSQTSSVKINVKKGTDTKTDIETVTTTGSGKIKVEKEQVGYNQGLKFTITGGDVSLTGGNKVDGSKNDITKLDEYETYEITEEGGKYYLTRKDEAIKTIDSQLGLTAAGCSLSGTSSICSNLTSDKLQKINFDGKDTNGPTMSTGNATLTITKVDKKDDFPLGYKFTLKSTTGDITIKASDNVVKKGISTDFKIKKGTASGQTPALSLEKAWTAESLGKKVGLNCGNGTSNGECSIANSGTHLKVRQTNNNQDIKEESLTKKSNSGNAKIKVTKDQEGYNQGFKFTVEGGSIELDGSKASVDSDKINILDEYETYEIKEDGNKWYLTRKEESIVFIKKQLGLDFCSDDTWKRTGSTNSGNAITLLCDISNVDNLKKINFHKKGTSHTWPSGKIELFLEMKKSRTNNANFGEWVVTISDNSSDAANVCVPDGNGGSIDLKADNNKKGAEYKIKKGTGGGTSASWCLEKSGSNSSGSCSS